MSVGFLAIKEEYLLKIKSIKPITPEEAHCISVGSPDKLFTIGEKGSLLTHNSVAQQNIIFSCILRPEHWVILGIDLKRVEITRFRKYGVNVAVDLETAVDFLRFAQAVMMKRYTRMEEQGVNDFKDLPVSGQALLLMIDEAGELLSPSGSKALSEHTPILTPKGRKPLGSIQIGDTVYDNNFNETKVINKYEPEKQRHFKLSITNDKTHEHENIIAGNDHLWVVQFKEPNGEISEPATIETHELYEFIHRQKQLPKSERVQLKIKRKPRK